MISKDYAIEADGTTAKDLFDEMNCYIFILEMRAGDVGNAYLEAYTDKKIIFTSGKEFDFMDPGLSIINCMD